MVYIASAARPHAGEENDAAAAASET